MKNQARKRRRSNSTSLYIGGYTSYKLVNNQLEAYKSYGYDISGTIGSDTYGSYPAVIYMKNYSTGEEKNYNTVEELSKEMLKNTSEINYIDVSSL